MTSEAMASPPPLTGAFPDFRAVFDCAPRPMLLVAADPPRYTMLAVNAAHARAFGTTPDALQGWGVLEVFPTDAGAEVDAFVASIRESFEAVLATGAPHQMPVRTFPVALANGRTEERFWAATNAPVFGPDGTVTHLISAIQDVTGEVLERQNEETRQLLMREVDHRARNALTIVQSFVRLTTATDLPSFREILHGRVDSLARAQTALVSQRWEGGDLREVLEGELGVLTAAERFRLSGPTVLLKSGHVQAMTMAIHELATNATKYGALSTDAGQLEVTWRTEAGWLDIVWCETGGPPAQSPVRSGFGSRLIAQLGRQLRGDVQFDWRPEGLVARIRLRLDALAPDPPRHTD